MSMPSCPRASFGAKQKLAESADKPIPYRTRCYLYVERFMQAGKRNVTVGLRRVEYEPLTQSARWVLNDPHLRHLEKVECGCSWLVSWPNQARVERPANLAHSAFQPLLEPDQLRVVLREPHKPCPTHEERLPSCLSSHDATYGACTLVTFTRSLTQCSSGGSDGEVRVCGRCEGDVAAAVIDQFIPATPVFKVSFASSPAARCSAAAILGHLILCMVTSSPRSACVLKSMKRAPFSVMPPNPNKAPPPWPGSPSDVARPPCPCADTVHTTEKFVPADTWCRWCK
mmetsp:Transcript_87863/g.250367  ORF Transcript_87863/g.250367 Transcript_87863/m.250367 type:complete len:285 (+) Transcript_87863:61-915(+)